MAVNYSSGLKTTRMAAVITAIDVHASPATIEICTAAFAAILCTITLADPSFTESGGVITMAGAPKSEIERRVPEFIKLVGLSGFESAFPYQMSGGMQQRCGLARALAVEPNVLLMDEPFAAVDAQTREILQFELLRIWEQRPTAMIFVTHSIEEAVLLGHRVIVLKGRPSSIHETITIDLPNPRTRDTLREPRFAELREQVWGTLMREAREAEFHLER